MSVVLNLLSLIYLTFLSSVISFILAQVISLTFSNSCVDFLPPDILVFNVQDLSPGDSFPWNFVFHEHISVFLL